MTKSLFIIFFLAFFQILSAQNSYVINGDPNDVRTSLLTEINEDIYWVFEAVPSGLPNTDYDVIRVTEFDQCGPLRSFQYTLDGAWGVWRFHDAFIQGDSLKLAVHFNPGQATHNFNEIGFFSIHTQDLGHSYHYIRADSELHSLSFFPTQGNKYFVHAFLSYTDRPVQFCSFLLSANFEVETYYENYGWGVVTGDAVEIDDGYLVATAKQIYKLDYNLNPVWVKFLPGYSYIRDMHLDNDAVVFRATETVFDPEWKRALHCIKLDFDGNLIWQSQSLNFDDQRDGFYRLRKNNDGNYEMAVQKVTHPENWLNKEMQIHTIDRNSGNILKSENSFNSEVLDSFRLNDYKILNNGQRVLLLANGDYSTVVWNISPFTDCSLEVGGNTNPTIPLVIQDIPTSPSVIDSVYTGSYAWDISMRQHEADLICSATAELKKQLPSDTLICEELGLELNLSDIPYDIVWEDGSTAKNRTINNEGQYSYQVNHCDLTFGESLIVSTQRCDCKYYLPNAFSPNGDLVNDTFYAQNPCEFVSQFQLSIYDRWGNLVFYSEDQTEEWNGNTGDQILNTGVYSYVLQYQSNFLNKATIQSGNISMVR